MAVKQSVAHKLIESHRVDGRMEGAEEIALRIDQTLTQDATGTTVMLELEAMGLERVRTELSAQYVDHNLLQTDWKNADDHLFLLSACRRYGIWYSRPGNGVSHPVHQQRFGEPGKSLLGSDSHTPAAGAIGMLAFGAGGLEVAAAMAGEPYHIKMPEIWGVRLEGGLPDWVSAKDVVLEMLRRHDVDGGVGRIVEYYGPGLEGLSAMDRHVIANMGTELGATTTVFPSDGAVRRFLAAQGRAEAWVEITSDGEEAYDILETIDLSSLEPLIALPSSPGNVVPVADVAGREVYQTYIGSSANPGLRDFAIAAEIVTGRQTHPRVSFDINPASRQTLHNMVELGYLEILIDAGARVHQAGCNGCIGMGQAPATNEISLRTVPRNFPGRSGTPEDQVYLCSPETAAASALTGHITDPRTLGRPYPSDLPVEDVVVNTGWLSPPEGGSADDPGGADLRKGPNIVSLMEFEPLPDDVIAPVVLKVGDDISTDEIMPAGNAVLPFRSNIPEIAKHVFAPVDPEFYERAHALRSESGCIVVGGDNYGQGSSREHAALAPRYLGLRIVLARSFARIHHQNLVNFGILPLRFDRPQDWEKVERDDTLEVRDITASLRRGVPVTVRNRTRDREYRAGHGLSAREIEILLQGGLIADLKRRVGKRS